MVRLQPPGVPEPSAVARVADGIVEAGWLLALALVPVFFNIHSGRPFEPDKTMLLRLLALLMAAAGLARALETRLAAPPPASGPARAFEGRPARARPRPSLLALSALAYVGAAALSTLLSIVPRLSLWGSYARLEGLLTLLAHVTVFAGIATRLRTRAQLDRALDAIVAASLPVCLYAVAQRLGLDTLDWITQFQEGRAATTLGNPVFAGAYLVLVLPVTIGALLDGWRRRDVPGAAVRLGLRGVAIVLQLVALGLTNSRGPWLAGAAALATLALLLAAVHGRKRLAGATLGLGLAAAAFVVVLNVPGGPLERLRSTPVFGRLGRLVSDRENRNPADRARLLLWQGALRLAGRGEALVVPGRGPDGAAALRRLVGYGPETMQMAYGVVYDPAFGAAERRNPDVTAEGASIFATRVPDRSHNETLDCLVTGGALGLLAQLALMAAFQVTVLRTLGLLGSRRDAWTLALCGGTGALAGVSAAAALGWPYVAATLPLGLAGGLIAFVLLLALRGRGSPATAPTALVAALGAAALGHFVEMQFGPEVVTGRLYFWALAGVLLALPRLVETDRPASPAWAGARTGLLGAALAVTVVYGFAGLKAGGGGRIGYATMAVLGGVTVGAVVALTDHHRRTALVGAATALAIGTIYAAYHLHALEATARVHTMTELYAALGGHFTVFAWTTLALAVALGVALAAPASRPPIPGLLRLGGIVGGALLVGVPPVLDAVNADVLRFFAATFQAQGRFAESVALFEEATRRAPGEPTNFEGLGMALLAATRTQPPPARHAEILRRAEAALVRARDLNPLSPDHRANLARVERRRAELDPDPASARRHAEQAAQLYADALALTPHNPLLIDETAEHAYQRLDDYEGAERTLLHSWELDPSYDYTAAALGDLYAARARARHSPDDWRRAAEYYRTARGIRPSLKPTVNLGFALKELGDTAQATQVFEQALAMGAPPAAAWALHEQLVGLYLNAGRRDDAYRQAVQALAKVPESEKAGLTARLRAAQLLGS